ncbi:MAG: hypothetical protein CGW95_09925 [Phenylobacterium zucineum]|nr:MAG: hypothetical protein CGW95_09925 [Phenylobacterium zucineum]
MVWKIVGTGQDPDKFAKGEPSIGQFVHFDLLAGLNTQMSQHVLAEGHLSSGRYGQLRHGQTPIIFKNNIKSPYNQVRRLTSRAFEVTRDRQDSSHRLDHRLWCDGAG